MSARDTILGSVRTALGRRTGQPPPPVPEVRLRPVVRDPEEKIVSFCSALDRLAAKTCVVGSPHEAAQYVHEVVGDRIALATGGAAVRECGIRFADAEISKAEVGVTGADYGLADTGSLVVLSASEPRLASLLPPIHIALLKQDRLLSGLDELLILLPRPAEQTASVVLITGPSRTADIEQILVRGVHGPGELHVVIFP